MNSVQDKKIEDLLREVSDPEIPVLTIMDMGVVREIELNENGKDLLIKITPTYSGCPAMDTIATDIKLKMDGAGYNTTVKLILSPAWTTDWITKAGREALEKYGIAAPLDESSDKLALIDGKRIVKCTNCGSTNTKLVSQFGSTACKALFQCEDCLEPFDYFKCLK
jgi:ring-1,2-phenylacetyl-CoA epoxidase subunit PaaD